MQKYKFCETNVQSWHTHQLRLVVAIPPTREKRTIPSLWHTNNAASSARKPWCSSRASGNDPYASSASSKTSTNPSTLRSGVSSSTSTPHCIGRAPSYAASNAIISDKECCPTNNARCSSKSSQKARKANRLQKPANEERKPMSRKSTSSDSPYPTTRSRSDKENI